MAVKTSAQLSREKREFNGLDRISDELVDQPRGTRYAVVAFEVKRVTDEIDEGVHVPTVQFTHIEPVTGALADQVREMLAERYQDRTGKTMDQEPAALFDVVPGGGQDDDGEREVPEASGEEIMAERRERKEAEAAAEAERAGGVAPPAFSDGGEGQ